MSAELPPGYDDWKTRAPEDDAPTAYSRVVIERDEALAECERLRGEVSELRTAVMDVCGTAMSSRRAAEAVAAYRHVANDTSGPFSIDGVRARIDTIRVERDAERDALRVERDQLRLALDEACTLGRHFAGLECDSAGESRFDELRKAGAR